MADRRPREHDSPRRRKRESPTSGNQEALPRARAPYNPNPTELPRSYSSSSSSSYIDISRTYSPERPKGLAGILAFFSAPREHYRRPQRRRSRRALRPGNASTSSLNSDLAYGTGFVRRRKGDKAQGKRRERDARMTADPDAEIRRIGAELAEVARRQNRSDRKESQRLGGRPITREDSGRAPGLESSRGLGSSKISNNPDEDGWESASDADSETSSVDSRLAYGGHNTSAGWGWGSSKLKRKDSVVDPKLFGPQNSLLGVVNEPVGFHDNIVDHSDLSDFMPPTAAQPEKRPRVQSSASGTGSMQYVYPVPTSDPNKFDVGRNSAVSGQESYTSRPDPVPIQTAQVPIQQPQPMAPVSQSVYNPSYTARSEPSIPTISSRTKPSVAGAALAGVAGAAIGASMISDRKDKERRRDDRDRYDDGPEKRRERRPDETEEERERRRERRRNETEDEREKRRAKRREEAREDPENDREKRRQERSDDRDNKIQEERHAERSRDGRDDNYWEDKYKQRRDDRYDDRPTKTSDIKVSPVDPFQFQVPDDAFRTPDGTRNSDPITSITRARSPAIVTVERVPHWHREGPSSTIEDKSVSPADDGENERGRSRERARTEREAESIYEETEHFTAPIEIGAVGAAVAAVSAEEKRRFKKRSREDRDDQGGRDASQEPDPIQAEADRIYREAVLARKIASSKAEDDPVIRVVTPPEMSHKKKPSLYDAPNADFELDKVMDPVEFMISPIKGSGAYPSDYMFDDTSSSELKRPLLTLVRPTPTPSPAPEKRKSKSRSKDSSQDERPSEPKETERTKGKTQNEKKDQPTEVSRDAPMADTETKADAVQTPTPAGGTRNVTWGENETKHYEVETPYEHRDDPIASSTKSSDTREKPKMSPAKKASAWGAVRGAFISGAAAAAVANVAEASKVQKNAKPEDSTNGSAAPFEYRGVAVEPEASDRHAEERGPPAVGPKPLQSPSSKPPASQMPGAFEDDIDFTATLAAGLEDSGFDPNIVIKDPTYRRRSSPPGSNDDSPLKNYKQPFAETVSDLSQVQEDSPREKKTRDIGREDDYDSPSKLDKKSQKKRDKDAKRQSSETEALDTYREAPISSQVVEEPESYSEPPKSDKKDRKAKKSKKDSNGYDNETNGRSDRRVSVPIDAFDDLHSEPTTKAAEEDEWATPKKSKKKSKRDSDRYDSPAMSASEMNSSLELSSSKKPKEKSKRDGDNFDSPPHPRSVPEVVPAADQSSNKKSKRRSEQYDIEPEPKDIPLPPPTVSEISKDDDDLYRKSKKPSKRDSSSFSDVADTRSVISEPARDDDYESRKSKKSSKRDSSSFSDVADTRSVKSSSTSKYDDDKPTKKEKKSGGFFGIFGSSKPDVKSDSKSDNRSEPDRSRDTEEDTDAKRKSKKSQSRRSTGGDSELYHTDSKRSSNGNDYDRYDVDDGDPIRSTNGDGKHERAGDKEESFLGNAGTLGAGVGIVAAAAIASQHLQSKAAQADGEERASEESAVELVLKPGAPVFPELRDLPAQEVLHQQFPERLAQEEFHHSEGPPFIDSRDLPDKQRVEEHAFKTPSDHFVEPEERSLNEPLVMSREEVVDPEITEREFRVAIDPEWRDLLPLPPSGPGSPNNEPILLLPALPESRPGTPPKESHLARDRSSGSARRNDYPTPSKTPSRSAVPIKYILGNRSTPSSPGGLVRGPSATDPAIKSPDNLMYPPKPRPRPTSWDSTKRLRTLSLLDPNRQEVSSPGSEIQRHEPAVEELLNIAEPDSSTSNREIPEERISSYVGNVAQMPSFTSSDKMIHESQSMPETSVIEFPKTADLPSLPDSRPITPVMGERTETPLAGSYETVSEERSGLSELPPLPESRNSTPFEEDVHHDSSFFPGALATGAALGLSTAAVAALSSHEEEDKVPEMASKSTIPEDLPTEFQVEPITKDRSSYLFQATPPTKRFEESGIESPLAKKQRAPEEASPTSAKASLRNETPSRGLDSSQTIAQEREAALKALGRPESDEDEPSVFATPPESVKAVEPEADAVDDFSYEKPMKSKKGKKRPEANFADDEPSVKMVETPLLDTAQEEMAIEEFPIKKSKKVKKKQNSQTFPYDEPSSATSPAPEADATEEFFVKKSSKDKKKGKKRGMDEKDVEGKPSFALDSDTVIADATHEAGYFDDTSPVSRTVELPPSVEERLEPPEIEEEFSLKKSKKGNKKDKKKALDAFEAPEESSSVVSTAVEANSEALPPIAEKSLLLSSVGEDLKQDDNHGQSSVVQSTNDTGSLLGEVVTQPLGDTVLSQPAEEAPEDNAFENEYPLKKTKKSKKKDNKKGLMQLEAEDEPLPVPELPLSAATVTQEGEASDAFFSATSKRDKKKDKKKGKMMSRTPTMEAIVPVDLPAPETEEITFSKAQETPLPISRALSEADFGAEGVSSETKINDVSALAPLLPVAAIAAQNIYTSDEPSFTPSKKDKKKDKKNRKGLSQSWTPEETIVPESSKDLETPGRDLSWPAELPPSLSTDPLQRREADEANFHAPINEHDLSRAIGIPLPIEPEGDDLDPKSNDDISQAVQEPLSMTSDDDHLKTKIIDETSRAAATPLPDAFEDDGNLATEPADKLFEAPVQPVAIHSEPDGVVSKAIDEHSTATMKHLLVSSESKPLDEAPVAAHIALPRTPEVHKLDSRTQDEVLAAAQVPLPLMSETDNMELNAQDESFQAPLEPSSVTPKAAILDPESSDDLSVAAQTPLPIAREASELDTESRDITVRPEDSKDSFENISTPFSVKESKKGKKKGRNTVSQRDVNELSISEPAPDEPLKDQFQQRELNAPGIEFNDSLAAQEDSSREPPQEFLPTEGSKIGKKKKGKSMQVWEAEKSSVPELVEGERVKDFIQDDPLTESPLAEGPTMLERTVDHDAVKAESLLPNEKSGQVQAPERGFDSYSIKDSKKGKKKKGKSTLLWEPEEETMAVPAQNEPVLEPVAREFTAEDDKEQDELKTENNEASQLSEPTFEEFNVKGSKKSKKKKGKSAEFWEPEASVASKLIGDEMVEEPGKKELSTEEIVPQNDETKMEDHQDIITAANQDTTDPTETPSETFGMTQSNTSKKKKDKSTGAWEPHDTPNSNLIQEKLSTVEPTEAPVAEDILQKAQPLDDDISQNADPVFDSYDLRGSKKSKKKRAKSQDTRNEDEAPGSLPITKPMSEPPTEVSSEREDFSGFSTPTVKGKGKKKQKRKSVAWDTEEPEEQPSLDSSHMPLPTSIGDGVLNTIQSGEEIRNVSRGGPEEPKIISQDTRSDEVPHEVKQSKLLEEEKALSQVHAPTTDNVPLTPVDSDDFATAQTGFSSTDYFPSTAPLHSSQTHKGTDDKTSYFPSAVSILPVVAAGAAIAAEFVAPKAHMESKSTLKEAVQPTSSSQETTERLEESSLTRASETEPSVNAASTIPQETTDTHTQHSPHPDVSAIPETEIPISAPKVPLMDRSPSPILHWPTTTATEEDANDNKNSLPSTAALTRLDAQPPAVAAGQEHLSEPLVKELHPSGEPSGLHLSAGDRTASKVEDPVFEQPSIDEETKRVEAEAEHADPNLPLPYNEEQLESTRQMDADVGLSRKKSKKNKKGQASVFEDDTPAQQPEEQKEPALTVRETDDTEAPSEPRTADGLAPGYNEDQVSIARQLQAEFETGIKKTKKNRKGRAALSQASTQDEDFPTQSLEDQRDAETFPEDGKETHDVETASETRAPDGLAAGYKEDQLSLAKQLQAEFEAGTKKSKKGKKSRSTSRTPNQEYEPNSSYFEEPLTTQPGEAQAISRDFLPDVEEARPTESPDGFAAGFTPDQLELARQMREEFSSGSKKSKKDKKHQGLIRSATEDNFSAGDIGSEDVSMGTTEVDSATDYTHPLSQVATSEDFDSFSTKKGKKGKKRQSLLRSGTQDSEGSAGPTRDSSVQPGAREIDPSEKDLEIVATPTIDPLTDLESKQSTLPEEVDNFAFTTKKGKKESKKRQSLLRSDALDSEGSAAPISDGSSDIVTRQLETSQTGDDKIAHPTIDQPATSEDKSTFSQHDDFDDLAFTTKKGKKGNKKRQSLVQSTAQVEEPPTTSFTHLAEPELAEQIRGQKWTDPATAEVVDNESNAEAKFTPTITDEPETFSFISKKAKKGNKKRQNLVTSTDQDEETSAIQSKDLFGTETAQQGVDENDASRDITVVKEPAQPNMDGSLATPVDDAETFTFATKKEKKGKKKRQSGVSTPAQEEEPFPTPISIVTDPEVQRERASEFDETQVTSASVDLEIANLEAELNFSTKKSKKEKKGKKSKPNSGTITPQAQEALVGYQGQGKEIALGDGSLADRIWAEVMPAESTQPDDISRFPEGFQDPVELYRMENAAQGDQTIASTKTSRDISLPWVDEVTEAKTAHSLDQHTITQGDSRYTHTETDPGVVHKQDFAQDLSTEESTSREVFPDEQPIPSLHELSSSRVVQNDPAFDVTEHAGFNDDEPTRNKKDDHRMTDAASAGLVAAGAAVLAGALVHGKESNIEDSEAISRETGQAEPKKKKKSKGQAKIIDRESAIEEMPTEDPEPRDVAEAQKFGDHDDKNEIRDGEDFRSVAGPERQVEKQIGENGTGERHKRERTASMDVWQPASIIDHAKTPRRHEYEDVPAAIERDVNLQQERIEDETQQIKEQKAEKSSNEVLEELIAKPSKKSKKNKKQTRDTAWDTLAEQEDGSSTATEKEGPLSEGFEAAPSRQRSKKNKKQSRLAAWDALTEPEEEKTKDLLPTKPNEAPYAEALELAPAQETITSAIHAVDKDAIGDKYQSHDEQLPRSRAIATTIDEEQSEYRDVNDFPQASSKSNKDISAKSNRSRQLHISPPSPSPEAMEGEAKKERGFDEYGIGPEREVSGDNIRKKHRGQEIYQPPPSSLPPVLEEDNVEQPELGWSVRTPEKAVRERGIDDTNRDSALVTESPIPTQRRFGDDHEYTRDSGVHLGDTPQSKARSPAASTDDVLARMSWPAIDEASETVDLKRSQGIDPGKSIKSHAGVAAAAVAGTLGAAELISQANRTSRRSKDTHLEPTRVDRSTSPNFNRLQTPDHTKYRPSSGGSNHSSNLSSGTPPLRRSDRKISGDLRSLSQRSEANLAKQVKDAKEAERSPATSNVSLNPVANEGRVRVKDMADVYDGYGEGRIGSPMSPTRPHSMRRRQSMQVLDLEARVEQLAADNRMLAEAKTHAEHSLHAAQRATLALADRDAELDTLKQQLEWLHREVDRLKEVNDGLTSANVTLGNQHNERYGALETQHSQSTRELEEIRQAHGSLSAGTEAIITEQVLAATQERDREIAQLRQDLKTAQERIRELQKEILATKAPEGDFLVFRDEDYFDNACQQLCQHVQQWVLRFSKFSDMRACRLTSEINNDKIIDRLDNAILDGSDVDEYLNDRVKRRDVFMSMTMTMIWEFVFTRYLFGMDREQRQKLKTLEKTLMEVGPTSAVHRWRATTLTLLSKRNAFIQQREEDTEAVVQMVFQTLSDILPPPSQSETQLQEQLKRVMRAAIDLSIEMRTQCAEYMMLPPLRPEYDPNGDLAREVQFNAALMNERSGDTVSNEELEAQGAVVRMVLFPLVVKKGDDSGDGDDEIVVCPAQVLVAKLKRHSRHVTPEVMGQNANHSRMSLQSSMAVEQVPDI